MKTASEIFGLFYPNLKDYSKLTEAAFKAVMLSRLLLFFFHYPSQVRARIIPRACLFFQLFLLPPDIFGISNENGERFPNRF